MLPTPRNYAIFPAVTPSGKTVRMTIMATERAFLFFEGEEYQLKVIPVDADVSWYHVQDIPTHDIFSLTAHRGVLEFSYTFSSEQEYWIVLSKDDKMLAELHVYALEADLYERIALKGDLHAHSYRSDGARDPAALMGHYREQGFDFLALTDHNRFYPGGEIDEVYQGLNLGIVRLRGEEVHAPGSVIHIVHVGGKESVADQYVHHLQEYEAKIEEYMTVVPSDVPEQYRERYAKAMWATDAIHKAGGVAIFPHPFWRPGASKTHNACTELATMLLKSGMFDAYELVGGIQQGDINCSVAFWNDLRAEGLRIGVVGSSDVHKIEQSSHFPHKFTVCFAKDKEHDAILDAVREGYTVAVEETGTEYDRHYRCHGTLRLVRYSQFLLQYYFPALQRICQGEGSAMRSYAMGEVEGALIDLGASQSKNFSLRYFGRMAPMLPSDEMLAFEDKWRKIQLAGPTGKGSLVHLEVPNVQI